MGSDFCVMVTGGRDFSDATLVSAGLDYSVALLSSYGAVVTLVHGAMTGADQLADAEGRRRGWRVRPVPANWPVHGNAAGPIRNRQMVKEWAPDVCVAFPGGSGTEDAVDAARRGGCCIIRVRELGRYEWEPFQAGLGF